MDGWKRSGEIPAFGNWDFENELPITQYFECARKAGLVRYSSSSGESDPYNNMIVDHDLYAVDVKNSSSNLKKGMREKKERRWSNDVSKEHNNNNMMRKQRGNGKVCDVTEQPRKQRMSKQLYQNDVVPRSAPPMRPKPVDEDLYKIPPQLLRTTTGSGFSNLPSPKDPLTSGKKMLGFISKFLVPAACVS